MDRVVSMTSIMWFRRDLRLHDNPALLEACSGGDVVPVFVLDSEIINGAGALPMAFFLDCLRELNESLEGHLVIRSGDPVEIIPSLAREAQAQNVYCAGSFTPSGMARDESVEAKLSTDGKRLVRVDSAYAVAPGSVLKGDGTPFKVFTPFLRAWQSHGWSQPQAKPSSPRFVSMKSEDIELAPQLNAGVELADGGEVAALKRLESFLENDLDNYEASRDNPAQDSTSRLSPFLRFGCIHPRQILSEMNSSANSRKLISELCWREFHADVLFNNPDSLHQALQPKMRKMKVDTGKHADELFEAWKCGQTGYPIVDAGMRQLLAEGFIHNRVRMIVASFLVKDLHIDWSRGAEWFLQHLIDGDIASNTHNWQWVAGTGTDAAPFFRIFNPITQSKKFDPDGSYIRRWVPELGALDSKAVHEPWNYPLESNGYVLPIVDHEEERNEALRRYDALKTAH